MEAVIPILQDDSLKLGKPVKYLKKKISTHQKISTELVGCK